MSDASEPYAMPVGRRKFLTIQAIVGAVLVLAVAFVSFLWFVVRVEVNPEELLVLVNKTGKRLPAELADEFGDRVVLYPELVAKSEKTLSNAVFSSP